MIYHTNIKKEKNFSMFKTKFNSKQNRQRITEKENLKTLNRKTMENLWLKWKKIDRFQ